MHFRLLSFNIHKGIGGVDRRYDLARVVDTINFYEPDVVLLQEVDEEVPRSRHHRQAELLADAIKLPHVAFQRNVRLKVGHYGNAILSRFPLTESHDIDLTLPPKKRRGALVTRLSMPAGEHTKTILLANIHLGLSGLERQIQLRRLLASECLSLPPCPSAASIVYSIEATSAPYGRTLVTLTRPAALPTICRLSLSLNSPENKWRMTNYR
jgi:endonuclease/exonuclease/phosphatase family metal-dependent hydrolase